VNHRAIDPLDSRGRVAGGDFNQGVALPHVHLANPVGGDSALAGDGADDIARLHAIARADGHEQTRHLAGAARGARRPF